MLLAEMSTIQVLIVNMPQILTALGALVAALGVGKTLQEIKKNREDLQQVHGKVEACNQITDSLATNVETTLLDKDEMIRQLTAENARLKSKMPKRETVSQ